MRASPILLSSVLLLAACEDPAPRPGDTAMPGPAEGRALFADYCSACHGDDGTGGGPLSRASARPPADLTLIALRNGGDFPTARVLSTVDGYARSDMAGPVMPEFGELLSGDLVPYDTGDGIATPTPRRMVALVEYLRTLQQTR